MKIEMELPRRAFETIEMLQSCRDDANKVGRNITELPNVSYESFRFVLNEAIDVIIKLYGGVKREL